jgi:hypothetical protein
MPKPFPQLNLSADELPWGTVANGSGTGDSHLFVLATDGAGLELAN